jgi:hypothetical protein
LLITLYFSFFLHPIFAVVSVFINVISLLSWDITPARIKKTALRQPFFSLLPPLYVFFVVVSVVFACVYF